MRGEFKGFSDELRNGAVQIWRGVVCFSRDFTFRINILNSISTPHKHLFFIITYVLSLPRDLPHPFLTFYFNPNLHHFINNTCNLIHFLSMTIDTKLMELIGVILNYLRFVNYSWVARDVTKNQTKKLSILLSFYFNEVLQYLNIFT